MTARFQLRPLKANKLASLKMVDFHKFYNFYKFYISFPSFERPEIQGLNRIVPIEYAIGICQRKMLLCNSLYAMRSAFEYSNKFAFIVS